MRNGFPFSENIDDKIYTKPVLFVFGRQDKIVDYKDSIKILKNYPRASICVIDEAGHCVHIEKARILNSLITDWLERIERNKNNI